MLAKRSPNTHGWMELSLKSVFMWLNVTVFITLVPKIDAAAIQNKLQLTDHKQCLRSYFYN